MPSNLAFVAPIACLVIAQGCKRPEHRQTNDEPRVFLTAASLSTEATDLGEPQDPRGVEPAVDTRPASPPLTPARSLSAERWLAAQAAAAWSGARDHLRRQRSEQPSASPTAEPAKADASQPAGPPVTEEPELVDVSVTEVATAQPTSGGSEEPTGLTQEEVAAAQRTLTTIFWAGSGQTGIGAGSDGYTGIGAGSGFTGTGAGNGFTGMGAGNGFTGMGAGNGFTGFAASASPERAERSEPPNPPQPMPAIVLVPIFVGPSL